MPLILSGTSGIPAASLNGQVPDGNAPSGSVVQIQSGSTTVNTINASSTYAATNLTVIINKQFTNSRIYIQASAFIMAYIGGGGDATTSARIYEANSAREVFDFRIVARSYDSGDVNVAGAMQSLNCIDEVSGTGSRTYRLEIKCLNGADARFNLDSVGQCHSTIHALEIMG